MSKKRSVPTKGPKRPRKMLTIAEKVKLLDMLMEGKSYAAVGRHYGINESSVRYIKKEENNIRTTAAICFNKDAKRVVTVRNEAIVRMESALALWISDCRKKSITLDTNVICAKAKKLYETFADSDVPHDSEGDADPGLSTSSVHVVSSTFNASKGWFEKFQKRFGLKNVSLHGEVASADTPSAEEYVSNKFKAIIEEGGYMHEQVFKVDETALFWKKYENKEEEEGLTHGRLATMMRMATELQHAAQEWDPLMCRSLQFSNLIEGSMSVYKNLLAQKKKEQQLPITMLFSRRKTPAQPSV